MGETQPEPGADRRVDAACDRFEAAWNAGEGPRIEDYLAGTPQSESPILFRELLALELSIRWHAGQRPDPEEYRTRFPGRERILDDVFRLTPERADRGDATGSQVNPALGRLIGVLAHRTTDRVPDDSEVTKALASQDRYEILRPLDSGGMGMVYLARHRAMDRRVALKVIRPDLIDREAVERFGHEMNVAAQLSSHPNLVPIFDADLAGPVHFLVMEFVEGTNLQRLVKERGRLPVALACQYVIQAAHGLRHLHAHGMVHRDIKPKNLMLTPFGEVKVLDFGLAQFVSEAHARRTSSEIVLGSVDYLAPEQAADPHSATIQSDLYSLGCTLYYLLTGQPPFPIGSDAEKVQLHRESSPRPVSAFRQDVPAGLQAVLDRMMAKDPFDRYQLPDDVSDALEPFAAPAAVVSPRPAGIPSRPEPTSRTVAASGAPQEPRTTPANRDVPARDEAKPTAPRHRWWPRARVAIPWLFVAASLLGVVVSRFPPSDNAPVAAARKDGLEPEPPGTADQRSTEMVLTPADALSLSARRQTDTLGMIVPAFFPMGTLAGRNEWDRLIAASRRDVPMKVVINPEMTEDSEREFEYGHVIELAHQKGIAVLGYVDCNEGKKPITKIEFEVSKWCALYPEIEGFFFNRQTYDVEHVEHFAKVFATVRHLPRKYEIVSCAFAPYVEGYLTKAGPDVICLLSTDTEPKPLGWVMKHESSKFAALIAGVPDPDLIKGTITRAAGHHMNWVYAVTSDVAPDGGWHHLPSFFESEVEFIASLNASIRRGAAPAPPKKAASRK